MQKLIAAKSPNEVFDSECYKVASITNGVRVFKSADGTVAYVEYSVKGVSAEYALRKIMDKGEWKEWNSDIEEANIGN